MGRNKTKEISFETLNSLEQASANRLIKEVFTFYNTNKSNIGFDVWLDMFVDSVKEVINTESTNK